MGPVRPVSMTGEPILLSHSLPVVYHVLVSLPIAAHSRACLVVHQLPKHRNGSSVLNTQTYGRTASWHRLIVCSNLLGKHDEAPLLCPVLDLICRGKAPHCRQPSSGSREGTSKRQGRDPPSSPFTFHANVDFNTTQTGPIVGNPQCQSFEADNSHTIGNIQLTKSTISCRAFNRRGVEIAVQQCRA